MSSWRIDKGLHFCYLLDLRTFYPLFCQIMIYLIHQLQGAPVTNHRGKKNLVLSGWGDESLLYEDSINPYYEPTYYGTYSEQTRQNLVLPNFSNFIFIKFWWIHDLMEFWPLVTFLTEKIKWRCYWLWSSWRYGMPHWWNFSWRCHTRVFTGKLIDEWVVFFFECLQVGEGQLLRFNFWLIYIWLLLHLLTGSFRNPFITW